MSNAIHLTSYIIGKSLNFHDFSTSKLIKIIFLSDWKHVLNKGAQATEITWCNDGTGPGLFYLNKEVIIALLSFIIQKFIYRFFKTKLCKKTLVGCASCLTKDEEDAVDHVIGVVGLLDDKDLSNLVNSTFPIISTSVGMKLDLPKLSQSYVRRLSIYKPFLEAYEKEKMR